MPWLIEERKHGIPEEIIEKHRDRISNNGPTRIILNSEGEACPPKRAVMYGAKCEIILVRNDGWSLGTSSALFKSAFSLYEETWIAILTHEVKIQNNVSISKGDTYKEVSGCLNRREKTSTRFSSKDFFNGIKIITM